MKHRILLLLMTLLLTALIAGSLSAQQVYRWVDEDGNVHFSDTPPDDEDEAERVQIRSGPSALDEDADEGDNDAADRSGPRLSEAECEGMRERLAEYRDADVLYQVDADGEEIELEPEVAEAEMNRIEEQIERYCD
ncbi:DUF4124 domain-containing protein [Gammaproteobacteria bacterium AB-CW1]|uniref:DUF4124 domain-containing protein n=1 Tax=Natronospira elongata TaxID=3110268 RepID=A0AAP6MJK1_9GAMM|nr:DUF4124 domain-containing protein [Gammaproteobacteria bacterium AB-CW1]